MWGVSDDCGVGLRIRVGAGVVGASVLSPSKMGPRFVCVEESPTHAADIPMSTNNIVVSRFAIPNSHSRYNPVSRHRLAGQLSDYPARQNADQTSKPIV